ncbi:MAG: hypothetical protein U0939_21135 [Pirellulales bacterium]
MQKKPILEGQAQKVKTERKGSLLIQGVCHGNATDLTLEVLEAEPNLPTKKIKDFISAATELTVKPQWLVVPQFTPVIDEENEAPAPPQRPSSPAPARPNSSSPDAGSLPSRLARLVARYQALIQATPALREKLLPFAQAAGTAVTSGNATAIATVDKFEQALTLVERSGPQAPPRPAQGPGGNSTAPPRPSQGPPTGSSATGRGGARPSLFERAKHRLKNLGRDVEKEAVFEEMRCSAD